MSITKFSSELKARGIAKQSHYLVEIMPPPFYYTPVDESFIPLFCEQTQMPEMALATDSIKDNGITRESVYDKMYGTITMSFICDQNMIIKSFFDRWIQGIVMSSGGVFAYPKEYTVPWINIHQLNEKLDIIYSVKLINCYPKVVNDIILTNNSKDYNRFQVVFVYEKWESETKIMSEQYIQMRSSGLDIEGIRSGLVKASAGAMIGEFTNGVNRTDYSKIKLNSLNGRSKSLIDNFTDWK